MPCMFKHTYEDDEYLGDGKDNAKQYDVDELLNVTDVEEENTTFLNLFQIGVPSGENVKV